MFSTVSNGSDADKKGKKTDVSAVRRGARDNDKEYMMGSSSSQSPRANRSSTQDPLEHAKGKVQIEQNPIRKDGGPENADAWQYQGKRTTTQRDV